MTVDNNKLQELFEKLNRNSPQEYEGKPIENNPEREYMKYGIFDDAMGEKQFLCIRMIADDTIESIRNTPIEELENEDFVMDKPMRYSFDEQDWVETKGLGRMISDTSFRFVEEEHFCDVLLQEIAERKTEGPSQKSGHNPTEMNL